MDATADRPVDAVIVGAGAAGAAVAWRMAKAGLSISVLDRGPWLNQQEAANSRDDWEWVMCTDHHPDPGIRKAPADYPVTADDTPIRPAYYAGIGGSTLHWGAHFPRFHPSDFKTLSLDGVGRDWPIDYWDLEPYYDLNDQIMGVSGLAGDPANPVRASRAMPPVPLCAGTQRLAEAADRLGWHWWPSDSAINLDQDGLGRNCCNQCGPCGMGCPRHARASTDITYWPLAIEAGVTVRPEATVGRIETDDDGRARSVLWRDRDGAWHRQAADLIVLAANGMGTPRLMLHSVSAAHPNGIGNSRDQVGRHLMHHPTALVSGVFDESLGPPAGPFACALYSQEFYETDRPDRDAMRGYQMQAIRGQGPLGTALGGYVTRLDWGHDHHRQFENSFQHTVSLTVTTEDLPEPENRVDLDDRAEDAAGVPAARLTYRVSENSQRLLTHGIERTTAWLHEAGAVETKVTALSRQAGFHFLGTVAMGEDPDRFVVDPTGRVRDCPGLAVVDGSVFPSAGGVNPTSTLQANALRLADLLAGQTPMPRGRAEARDMTP